jgi:hypothetical protein
MLSAKNGKAFRDFYDAVRDEAVLDRKTTILLGLAVAMTSGCAP